MAWPEARSRLVTIIEGTTVPTKMGGGGAQFHYEATASRQVPPTTRGFWFDIEATHTRRLIRAGGTWEVARLQVLMAYSVDLHPERRLELMLRDRAEISARLLSSAQWGQPSSTIEKIAHGGEDALLPTDFEDAPGVKIMKMNTTVEYTS